MSYWKLFFFLPYLCFALEVPPLTGPVIDLANLLSPDQRMQLAQTLRRYHQEHDLQFQLLTIPSLDGESLEEFSIKVVDEWKLGQSGDDKGLLFLIAFEDRLMRIEVGRGLEGMITDASAGRVIDLVTPYFKQGQYSLGINQGFTQLVRFAGVQLAESASELPPPTNNEKRKKKFVPPFFTIFFILLYFILLGRGRRFGRRRYWGYGGGFSGSGSSGWSGGGWSGGGGGFSGGGASGRW